jgi:hypothetical protein
VACRTVGRTIATSVVRLVIGAHGIVRTNCRPLESAAQDGGKSWRRSNKAAEGALCPPQSPYEAGFRTGRERRR